VSQQLNGRQRTFLRALAHHLDPVVQIGRSGMTDAVMAQIREQLVAHELIKIRFGKEAPEGAAEASEQIATATDSMIVQTSGRVLALYRRHDHKPRIQLPTKEHEGAAQREAKEAAKRDPRRSLNRIHAAKRARGAQGQATEDASDTANLQSAPRRARPSRLMAPKASNPHRRATVTARRRTRSS
jgi:RNA-binding protein